MTDFDYARRCHAALRDQILAYPGGADEHALRRVLELCRKATRAVSDGECAEALSRIEDLALDFFSDEAHLRWQRQELAGTAVLRIELMRTLMALRSRITHLQLREVGMLIPQSTDFSAGAGRPSAG